MEDDKQEPNRSSRGSEWEVVFLTASTYAAAPSPQTNDSINGDKEELSKEELGLSQMMSKSDFEHLVFPPGEHEDLPVNSDNTEIYNSEDMIQKSQIAKHEPQRDDVQIQWNAPDLTDSDVMDDIKFFDKGKMLSIQKIEFEEKTLQAVGGMDSDYQGHSLSTYSSDHDIVDESAVDQGASVLSTDSPLMQKIGSPSNFQENAKTYKYSGPLCEEWWKKQAASLYAHTKETDIYWSIFIAASIVGIVFIGKKWRQGIWRVL